MNWLKTKKVITHNGSFHTDEVFACAVLSILNNGKVKVIRSRDPKVWATGDYVVDVGGVYDYEKCRFDHHQEGGAGKRPNGIPYSSMGLVWKHFGEKISGSSEVAQLIDEKLAQPIDCADNGINSFTLVPPGVFPYLLHNVIASFRPTWKEESEERLSFDAGFARACKLAKELILREIKIAQNHLEGDQKVLDCYNNAKDKRIIVIDGQYPCDQFLLKYPEPLFVVKPDHEIGGRWKIKRVLKSIESFEARKLLPQAWAGKEGKELAEITGVADAIFCHNKRFIAVAGSKESALKLAELAIND